MEADPSIDPGLAAWLRELNAAAGPPARERGVAALRRPRERPRGPELPRVCDLVIPGSPPLPVRLYRAVMAPRPLVVFLHGGMWLLGDLDTHDRTCRRLARGAGVAVLAVDHRRAPEHPWPAAVDDAVRAVRWAAEHGGTDVAVAGDSSGGNLAALACLRLRDAGEPLPAAQVLICPNTDLTLGRPSVRTKGHGWGLDVDDLAWAVELWVRPPLTPADPRVSPLHAPDLSGLPPAVVVTAEHDPLRDEGDAFAARLATAGVAVRHRCETGLVHGFIQGLDRVSPVAAAAAERLYADVRAVLK